MEISKNDFFKLFNPTPLITVEVMERTADPGIGQRTWPEPAPTLQHFEAPETPQQKALLNLVFRSMKRTHDLFYHDYGTLPELDSEA